jgi:hypothetical protein
MKWLSLSSLVLLLALAIGFFAPMNATLVSAQFATNTPSGASTNTGALAATASPVVPQTIPTLTPASTATVPPKPTVVREQVFDAPACQYVPNQPTSQACIALMQKYPEPDVTDIQKDGYTLGNYSFWKIPNGGVPKYDNPGGNITGEIANGFNFIHAINSDVPDWLQIEGGEWIQRSFAEYRPSSQFTGVLLPEGWNQPFGWVLDTTGIYASLYPGGPSTSESGLVPLHYERYNIFAESVDSEGWKWYLVGPNQWVKQVFMAVIMPTPRPENVSGYWVAVDLFEQTLVAYEDDTPIFATLISSGLPDHETNEGLFEVWAAIPRDAMSGAAGAPDAYALQSVPWVMYFDGGISLHGTYWHDTFGYRRSHGCVNLSISDARWVFEWRERSPNKNEKGDPLMQVVVYQTDQYREGDNK